ncbi:ABC transporter permease [Sciscionella sediminilitoris]|uniref:ABC transporter permease n=1 Tax=Sciscionella sediminilitoris TaxID=1445613 RepID=UPI0004DFAE5A|nr:ABC transporter permease [Sciscionella sp. SE31]
MHADPARATDLGDSRSVRKALADLTGGLTSYELWGHLGWQDIKQRYHRAALGPFWITIAQAVIALGLGLLNGLLFGAHFQTFLPYLATGLIVWQFINGCFIEGMEAFIANEATIKHVPAPLMVYVMRTLWRQLLMFLHTFIVYVVLLVIFFGDLDHKYSMKDGTCLKAVPGSGIPCHPGLGWWSLLAIPGFLLVLLTMGWVIMFFGIISTRFRDMPQLINAVLLLAFYMTPVVWPMDQLTEKSGRRHAMAPYIEPIIDGNPIYHLIQVVRQPLTGGLVSMWSYVAVGLMVVVGWAATLLLMRGYRGRVSYWV